MEMDMDAGSTVLANIDLLGMFFEIVTHFEIWLWKNKFKVYNYYSSQYFFRYFSAPFYYFFCLRTPLQFFVHFLINRV
ncbi:hypothetical protein BD770DRAFT_111604 [Pilaira anomala]|nr:hypothetical protein BD770DRAFT_111604 [Pilaira anomala]